MESRDEASPGPIASPLDTSPEADKSLHIQSAVEEIDEIAQIQHTPEQHTARASSSSPQHTVECQDKGSKVIVECHIKTVESQDGQEILEEQTSEHSKVNNNHQKISNHEETNTLERQQQNKGRPQAFNPPETTPVASEKPQKRVMEENGRGKRLFNSVLATLGAKRQRQSSEKRVELQSGRPQTVTRRIVNKTCVFTPATSTAAARSEEERLKREKARSLNLKRREAHFLKTKQRPELVFLPRILTSWEKRQIDAQVRASQPQRVEGDS